MQKLLDAVKTMLDAAKSVGALLPAYPGWAQVLFILSGVLVVVSLVVFAVDFPKAREQLDPTKRLRLADVPYPTFKNDFREVVAAYRLPETESLLHILWGNLGDVRNTSVVLPLNQSFDTEQRGSRSVLAAFNSHTVGGVPFYDYLDNTWPRSDRPAAAGIGTTKFLALTGESHGLLGAVLVVTTRDRSRDPRDYGLYKNTPIEGIDYILDKVLQEARAQRLESIAIPLLGAGYANVQRTHGDPHLKALLEQSVVLLSVDRLLKTLGEPSSSLRRAMLVIYSSDPHSEDEDELWNLVPRFLTSDAAARQQAIRDRLNEFSKRED